MKKTVKWIAIGSIVAPIGAAVSCSNVPHQAPIPFEDERPKLLEKELPVVPPKTILDGKFRHDPKRFDEIKEELGKVTSITENGNTIIYHTSHSEWHFNKSDIEDPKFALLKNQNVVKKIIKECISSLNIMLPNVIISLVPNMGETFYGRTQLSATSVPSIKVVWPVKVLTKIEQVDFFTDFIKTVIVHEYGHNLAGYFFKIFENESFIDNEKTQSLHWKNYIKKIFSIDKMDIDNLASNSENVIEDPLYLSKWYPEIFNNNSVWKLAMLSKSKRIDPDYYYSITELITRIPSNYFYKTIKGYKNAFNLYSNNWTEFQKNTPLSAFSSDINDSLFNVENKQEAVINNELFLDEVIGANDRPKISKIDFKKSLHYERTLRFEGFKVDPSWDRVEIRENGISESAKITREDIAFGFNRRPYPDEYDYKYVTNLSSICYKLEHRFSKNAKIIIYDSNNEVIDPSLYDVVDVIAHG